MDWLIYKLGHENEESDGEVAVIPIVVFWTNYTATVIGRVVKLVACEDCHTEYVYVLEREGVGAGNSVYGMSVHGLNEDPGDHAVQAARDTLQQYLENDFDPVPCPICGHYQKFMFPKLYRPAAWIQIIRLVSLMLGCLTAVVATLSWAFVYLDRPGNHALGRLGMTSALFAILGSIFFVLGVVERSRASRFNPDTEDQQVRIEKGRSRAVTRAEFEAQQKRAGQAESLTPLDPAS